ncbi:restriction endonuclease subunit S [Salmonella enterica]|uniref:restriction endonuclease subunit S n=1 Tax=Enterobacter cloacae complex TaxID=354276 RepID=UPI000F9D10DB|nr:restriction endonuclease subunit S [Enterobacter roggenkampii]EAA9900269.1 restriction endonuclease subunit S [Salmonella enterica subsp. enterica serovar Thompson]EAN2322420.1 restriction endonuclease subunit S [Salmonella enterica]ECS6591531.1 restriction endonuclease subunit S [Salmonella enterica subsp. enterica serovar 6,7:-:1,5]EDB0297251.1 restriction endonuclease subunit S [Salmonella enterica subsp. enterica serovar Mbandaka]EKQ5012576.1 restriction endonuclease subunit S [Salmonel
MSELSYLGKLLDSAEVEWLPLGVLGELVRGNGLPKTDFTESGIPAIHYGQIYTFYSLSTETTMSFVSEDTAKKLRKVNTGDVVITNTSENLDDVGKALVYLGKEQAVTGGHATIFKPKQGIIGKYFAYFTQTNSFYNEKRKYSKGTKVIDVSASDMAKIIIPIPCPNNPEKSLAIQSEIVRILDKFTALTAELTAELTARKKQYNYYRDQLLSFEQGEVEWKTLGEITTKIASGRNKTRDADGKFPVYGSTGLIGFIDKAAYSGDLLLVARVGAYAGLVNAVSGHFDVSDNTLIIHPSDSWNVRFAFHQLRHMNLNQYAVGAGQPLITGGLLKNLKVPFPSLKEQTRIAKILDKFETITASISEGLPREIELRQKQYEYYRDLLFSFPKPDAVSN